MTKFNIGQRFRIIKYVPSNDQGYLAYLILTFEDGSEYKVMVTRDSYRSIHGGARFRGYIVEPPQRDDRHGRDSLNIELTHWVDGYILWGNQGGELEVVSC